jgi:hypothetical protein
MVVTMKSIIFWAVMQCSSEIAQRFGRTYRHHLQDQGVRQARSRQAQAEQKPAIGQSKPMEALSSRADNGHLPIGSLTVNLSIF